MIPYFFLLSPYIFFARNRIVGEENSLIKLLDCGAVFVTFILPLCKGDTIRIYEINIVVTKLIARTDKHVVLL
jgi:hypothetical protein